MAQQQSKQQVAPQQLYRPPQQRFTFVVTHVAVAAGNTFQLALGSNKQRQSVVISCAVNAGAAQQVDLSMSTSANDIFYSQLSPFTEALVYALYGPVIQEQFFVRSLNAGDRINFVETILLP